MRVHVEYAHTLDPEEWARRHAAGLVPDRWPYGLDRLAAHGIELTARSVASRVVDTLDGAARRLSGGFELVNALRHPSRRDSDVVLCWDERTGVPAAMRSRIRGEPPAAIGVIWITEPDLHLPPGAQFLAREALKRAGAVWAMSPPQLEILADGWGVPWQRLHLLHMGTDVDFWSSDGVVPEPDFVVGSGNDRHRDHELLVKAVARLHGRRPQVRLELASHHQVHIPPELGFRHSHLDHVAMRALYRRASVIVLALKPNAHLSGLSVLLETMALERPLVVTRMSGLTEYVRDGESALVVPPGDADALATAIEDLLADPDRARGLANAARKDVERFSTATQAARLLDIIRTV